MDGAHGPTRRQVLAGPGAWAAGDVRAAPPAQPLLISEHTERDLVRPLLQLVADSGGFEWQLR